VGHVARMGEIRNAYKILVRKSEGKGPLGRPRRRWEDNIIMNFTETGWGCGLDASGSEQGQVTGSCEHGNKHSVSIKGSHYKLLTKHPAPWRELVKVY